MNNIDKVNTSVSLSGMQVRLNNINPFWNQFTGRNPREPMDYAAIKGDIKQILKDMRKNMDEFESGLDAWGD